ncbi:hypothetical protein [Alloalcanivorax xenomutans]
MSEVSACLTVNTEALSAVIQELLTLIPTLPPATRESFFTLIESVFQEVHDDKLVTMRTEGLHAVAEPGVGLLSIVAAVRSLTGE